MPKQKITKEMIVQAAFEIARAQGMEQVLVKSIADALGCSVQPIYSYCRNMEGLRSEVLKQANAFTQKYIEARIDPENLFQSTGQAYVQLAKEEPHIFKMFILHPRDDISSLQELYESETNPNVPKVIAQKLSISLSQAKQLHLHMLVYTIGIGTIFSVTTPGIPAEEIFSQQELAYQAFLKQVSDHTE